MWHGGQPQAGWWPNYNNPYAVQAQPGGGDESQTWAMRAAMWAQQRQFQEQFQAQHQEQFQAQHQEQFQVQHQIQAMQQPVAQMQQALHANPTLPVNPPLPPGESLERPVLPEAMAYHEERDVHRQPEAPANDELHPPTADNPDSHDTRFTNNHQRREPPSPDQGHSEQSIQPHAEPQPRYAHHEQDSRGHHHDRHHAEHSIEHHASQEHHPHRHHHHHHEQTHDDTMHHQQAAPVDHRQFADGPGEGAMNSAFGHFGPPRPNDHGLPPQMPLVAHMQEDHMHQFNYSGHMVPPHPGMVPIHAPMHAPFPYANPEFGHPHGHNAMLPLRHQELMMAGDMDATRKKALPQWLREGLEQMEKTKNKKDIPSTALPTAAEISGYQHGVEEESPPVSPKAPTMEKEDPVPESSRENGPEPGDDSPAEKSEQKSDTSSDEEEDEEERQQLLMQRVKRMITDVLLSVTASEIRSIAEEVCNKAKQQVSTSKQLRHSVGLDALRMGFGSASSSEDESDNDIPTPKLTEKSNATSANVYNESVAHETNDDRKKHVAVIIDLEEPKPRKEKHIDANRDDHRENAPEEIKSKSSKSKKSSKRKHRSPSPVKASKKAKRKSSHRERESSSRRRRDESSSDDHRRRSKRHDSNEESSSDISDDSDDTTDRSSDDSTGSSDSSTADRRRSKSKRKSKHSSHHRDSAKSRHHSDKRGKKHRKHKSKSSRTDSPKKKRR